MATYTPNNHSNRQLTVENLAEKIMLVLRDGRKLIGVLRSWDQFGIITPPCPLCPLPPPSHAYRLTRAPPLSANLVLTSTTERYFVSPSNERRLFAAIARGPSLVRGENVLLIGEIVLDNDDDLPPGYTEAPIADVFALKKDEEARRKKSDRVRGRRAGEAWGGEMEASGEILF